MTHWLGVAGDCCTPEERISQVVQARGHGNDFNLLYYVRQFMRQFLAEDWGDIPELLFKGNYAQLVGYVRGRCDK